MDIAFAVQNQSILKVSIMFHSVELCNNIIFCSLKSEYMSYGTDSNRIG